MNRLALGSAHHSSRGQKVALAAIIFGGVAVVVGALVYGRSRHRERSGALGDIQARFKHGGMLLTHHYDREMPIDKRVAILQELVWKGVRQPQMRELALAITGNGQRDVKVGKRTFKVRGAGCPPRDGLCEAEAVYKWVKNNVRYTGDVAPIKMPNGAVEGIDLFQAPLRTVEFGGEDCDGHSVLNATLLTLNGIPAKFRVTAPTRNSDWAHIYNLFGLAKTNPKRWIPLDTTLPGDMFGKEAPAAKKLDFIA
jgi:hypothetical protein